MVKRCECCLRESVDESATCAHCGEQTWSVTIEPKKEPIDDTDRRKDSRKR